MKKQQPEIKGYKEVRDGVAIAAISAVFVGLVAWGIEEAKAYRQARINSRKRIGAKSD